MCVFLLDIRKTFCPPQTPLSHPALTLRPTASPPQAGACSPPAPSPEPTHGPRARSGRPHRQLLLPGGKPTRELARRHGDADEVAPRSSDPPFAPCPTENPTERGEGMGGREAVQPSPDCAGAAAGVRLGGVRGSHKEQRYLRSGSGRR